MLDRTLSPLYQRRKHRFRLQYMPVQMAITVAHAGIYDHNFPQIDHGRLRKTIERAKLESNCLQAFQSIDQCITLAPIQNQESESGTGLIKAGQGECCGIIAGIQSRLCGCGSTTDHGGSSPVRGLAEHAHGRSSRNCRQGIQRPGSCGPASTPASSGLKAGSPLHWHPPNSPRRVVVSTCRSRWAYWRPRNRYRASALMTVSFLVNSHSMVSCVR